VVEMISADVSAACTNMTSYPYVISVNNNCSAAWQKASFK